MVEGVALPPEVVTPRLVLRVWDAATVRALRAGDRLPKWHPEFPRRDDLDAAGLWREGDPWTTRSIVWAETGHIVGSIGFFGGPEAAEDGVPEVEVGYGVVPRGRGRGIGTEALGGLLAAVDAAGAAGAVGAVGAVGGAGGPVRVRASVAPTNAAGLKVLARHGFTQLRGTTEDGELVMVRPVGVGL
ncbi:GNAT family N-acetyltransferase [Nocardioides sp. GY 10113]|uniref:GNAT family N-acetyltransferase n=1 Tax=Nocardioides sp. GY 10113 TaxID=2569761 RepID=UPI0010A89D97|nr:GNAT family protein [Nocardioides sp. GY 10113]TIC83553.1 GNAT family N-acetyltransferase [Nocardioides sp. GY 10113]